MKKNTIIYLVLAVIAGTGICLKYFTTLLFLGGIICGSAFTILLFVTIGKWQAGRAAERIDLLIKQKRGNHYN